ncbi:MAG: PaaI family thioesterase [Bacteroidota bacterium]
MVRIHNPEYKSRIDKFLEGQHFMKHIDFSLNVIEPGRTEGWLELQEMHKQQKGFAHGGLIATLADITAGFAACTVVASDQHVVTGELKISYLNPGIGQKLHAIGYILKQGKKINFCESEIWSVNNEERTLIAKASTSMITIFPEDIKQ